MKTQQTYQGKWHKSKAFQINFNFYRKMLNASVTKKKPKLNPYSSYCSSLHGDIFVNQLSSKPNMQ